jgi:hypothetical protein
MEIEICGQNEDGVDLTVEHRAERGRLAIPPRDATVERV